MNRFDQWTPEKLTEKLVGKIVYTGWPFLVESSVSYLMDSYFKYELETTIGNSISRVIKRPLSSTELQQFQRSALRAESHYSNRFACILGEVDILVGVRQLNGKAGTEIRAFENESDEGNRIGMEGMWNE